MILMTYLHKLTVVSISECEIQFSEYIVSSRGWFLLQIVKQLFIRALKIEVCNLSYFVLVLY